MRWGWHPGRCWGSSGPAHPNRCGTAAVAAADDPVSSCAAQVKHPCILQHFDAFLEMVSGKRVAVFLDYDGESYETVPQQQLGLDLQLQC